jgi:hypothetical protein
MPRALAYASRRAARARCTARNPSEHTNPRGGGDDHADTSGRQSKRLGESYRENPVLIAGPRRDILADHVQLLALYRKSAGVIYLEAGLRDHIRIAVGSPGRSTLAAPALSVSGDFVAVAAHFHTAPTALM